MSMTSLRSDIITLLIECGYSNIGEEWIATATDSEDKEVAVGRGKTRPEALRELADQLEAL